MQLNTRWLPQRDNYIHRVDEQRQEICSVSVPVYGIIKGGDFYDGAGSLSIFFLSTVIFPPSSRPPQNGPPRYIRVILICWWYYCFCIKRIIYKSLTRVSMIRQVLHPRMLQYTTSYTIIKLYVCNGKICAGRLRAIFRQLAMSCRGQILLCVQIVCSKDTFYYSSNNYIHAMILIISMIFIHIIQHTTFTVHF